MAGSFVFGIFSYGGLGDWTWFAASCVHRPGVLVVPSLVKQPEWSDVVNVTVPTIDAADISTEKINAVVNPA